MELLGEGLRGRLYPVGRLDYDATGLLLLTSDGDLAHRLMHPSHQVPRTYRLTVSGEVSRETLRQLTAGVEIDGREVAAAVAVKKREEAKTRPGADGVGRAVSSGEASPGEGRASGLEVEAPRFRPLALGPSDPGGVPDADALTRWRP